MKQIICAILVMGLSFSVLADSNTSAQKVDTTKAEKTQVLRKANGTVPPAEKTNWSKIKDMFL